MIRQDLSINVIHCIRKQENKNHMIISRDAAKAFDKIQHPFLKKTLHRVGIEGNYLNIKSIYEKHTANIILNNESISSKIKNKARMSILSVPLLFNVVLNKML